MGERDACRRARAVHEAGRSGDWLGYGAGGLWKSTNAGVDWAQTFTDDVTNAFQYDFVEAAAMDPTNSLHLVVSPHGGCLGTYAPTCMAETLDGGGTWRLFAAPAWGEGSAVLVLEQER
jgi:hypothetical protein